MPPSLMSWSGVRGRAKKPDWDTEGLGCQPKGFRLCFTNSEEPAKLCEQDNHVLSIPLDCLLLSECRYLVWLAPIWWIFLLCQWGHGSTSAFAIAHDGRPHLTST